jgi:hypothetical protein
MSSVLLDQTTEIVGLFDISVSKVDNTVFVASKHTTEPGAINTFALYADEAGKIKSSGIALTYDDETETLTAPTISSHGINANYVITEYLKVSDNIQTEKITSDHISVKTLVADVLILNNDPEKQKDFEINHLNFLKKEGAGRFASIHTNFFEDHTLAVVTENDDGQTGCALTIDSVQRVTVEDGKLNLKKKRTIFSAVGSKDDKPGDIAIDNEYLYYCTRKFNGVSNIWIRWRMTDNAW